MGIETKDQGPTQLEKDFCGTKLALHFPKPYNQNPNLENFLGTMLVMTP